METLEKAPVKINPQTAPESLNQTNLATFVSRTSPLDLGHTSRRSPENEVDRGRGRF